MAKQKGLPTHRRLAALCTQIQPAMLEGTDLTRIRQASSPSRHSAKRKRAGRGRAAQVMLPVWDGEGGKSADSTDLTRTRPERSRQEREGSGLGCPPNGSGVGGWGRRWSPLAAAPLVTANVLLSAL